MFDKSLIALLGHSESLKTTLQELCLEVCQKWVLMRVFITFYLEFKFMH